MNTSLKQIRSILIWILFANLLVAFAKIIMGSISQSTSILADGFHSLTDGSGNVIGLIGIALASRPEDEDHPYGHAKIEMLGSLIIVALLGFLGYEILMQAFSRFQTPVTPSLEPLSFVVMVVTLAINIAVTYYEHKAGKRLNSAMLISDAYHTRSDVFVTIGVLLSLFLIKMGFPIWIDPLVSIGVVFFIFKAAYEIFKEVSPVLLDAKALDEQEIRGFLKDIPQIKEMHHIRSRGTLQSIVIDMHVLADDQMPLLETHQLSHLIESTLQKAYSDKIVQVICHFEPVSDTLKHRQGLQK